MTLKLQLNLVTLGVSDLDAKVEHSKSGYSGYLADPNGNLWEGAHNPFFPFDETGRMLLSA
jgi:uncharacterized protein